MKKNGDFIKNTTLVIFALLIVLSPLLANAHQLLEQSKNEIAHVETQEDDSANKEAGDPSSSSIDQTVFVNGHGNTSIVHTSFVKYISFSHYIPVSITDFPKYITTAFTPTLLCYIKNILLFFSAPHAP